MIRFQEVLAGIQERMAAVEVRIMMAFHPRELVAAVVVEEMQMEIPQRMVLAAAPVAATETAAAAAVEALMPVHQVELEEPVEQPPIRMLAAVVGLEEMMLPLVKSWELLVVLPVALEVEAMEVQRVQESPKLDREGEAMSVDQVLAEPVQAVVAVVANMELLI